MKFILLLFFVSITGVCEGFDEAKYQETIIDWRNSVDSSKSTFESVKSSDQETQNLNYQEHIEQLEHLNEVSKQRSNYLSYLYSHNKSKLFKINSSFLNDLKRELKAVPFKWYTIFFIKAKKLKGYLNSGFSGISKLVLELIKIFSIFFVPFFALGVSKKITAEVKKRRSKYVKLSYRGKKNYSFASEFMRLFIIYLPWLIALAALYVMVWLVKQSESLSDFADFILFFRYYIYYKILKKFIYDTLVRIGKTRSRHKQELLKLQDKATNHATKFGLILMWTYFLLDLIKSVVSKGLSYHIVLFISSVLIILLILIVAAQWREELSQKLKAFSLPHLSTWYADLVTQKKWFFLSLPALLIVLAVNSVQTLLTWLEKFDFVKKVTAQIFKKRLESSENLTEETTQNLPEDYVAHFKMGIDEDTAIFVNPENEVLQKVKKIIESWRDDKSEENSMAIVGETGIGKTTILSMIARNFNTLKVAKVVMKKRVSSEKDFYNFIFKTLGIEGEGIVSLIKHDKDAPKTLVLIDEAQNCFISKLGGFESFKALTEVLNAKLENIFFCISFNQYSWNYLNACFGKNQNFRNIVHIKGLSETDLRNIVMNRHNKTEYELSYLDIIRAVGGKFASESTEVIEDQFFRLLWEQSLGNPRVAIANWLSSLKFNGTKKFYLGLPQDDDLSKTLENMSDDTLFAFAAIVKHENLSVKEIMEITHLSEGAVRYAIRFGIDNSILTMKDTRTYTIDNRFQHTLIRYLKKKNLVYAR